MSLFYKNPNFAVYLPELPELLNLSLTLSAQLLLLKVHNFEDSVSFLANDWLLSLSAIRVVLLCFPTCLKKWLLGLLLVKGKCYMIIILTRFYFLHED